MKLSKNTILSLNLTFITFGVIFFLLWLLIYIFWMTLNDYFWKQFIKWIESKSYLVEHNLENTKTLEAFEKKIDEQWYTFNPEVDYFIKEDKQIQQIWLGSLFKNNIDFLFNLRQWEFLTYTVWDKEYFFYNDTGSDKIYVTNLFIKEIQEVLYDMLLYFLLLIIIPLFFLVKRLVRFHLKPIELSNQKLKEYNHNLAHEIKNPLSSILIHLEILKNWYNQELIHQIEQETKTVNNITDALLHLTEKTQVKHVEHYDLHDLLHEYKQLLDASTLNSINFYWVFHLKCKTDKELFFIILKNIIENGIKYSSDNTLQISLEKKYLVFKNNIWENIPQDELDKILHFFYRYKWLEKKWFWIWLWIVQTICDDLGHEIEIFSQNKIFILKLKFK